MPDERDLEIPELDDDLEVVPETNDDSGDDGKDVKGNVFARLRIVERENKVFRERFNDLLGAIKGGEEQKEEDEDIVLPTYEDEPLREISEGQKVLAAELAKNRKREKERAKQDADYEQTKTANRMILDFIEQEPNYKDAVQYLLEMEAEELMDEDASLDMADIDKILTDRMESDKKKWLKQGKNPGEQIYKRAIRRKFKPKAANDEDETPPARKNNAKEEIARDKDRESRTATVSRVPGKTAVNKTNATSILHMSQKEFDAMRDEVARQKGGLRSRVKMGDMIPEKLSKGARGN